MFKSGEILINVPLFDFESLITRLKKQTQYYFHLHTLFMKNKFNLDSVVFEIIFVMP